MAIDILKFKSAELALFWKDTVRKAAHLKRLNELRDEDLTAMNAELYGVLAKWLERGEDKTLLGGYFAELGKRCERTGIPVSEALYSLVVSQGTITEYVLSETALDSSLLLYQVVDVMTKMSEFFLLASFYLTKGFLEETYLRLNASEKIPDELLKTYFRDEFFFKDRKPS